VTGVANFGVPLTGRRVDLIKQAVPALARLAMFQVVADSRPDPAIAENVVEAQPVASALGIQLHALPLRSASDLEAAFDAAVRARAEPLLVAGSTFFQLNRAGIIALVARHRLPAIYGGAGVGSRGGRDGVRCLCRGELSERRDGRRQDPEGGQTGRSAGLTPLRILST
jgi:putative ABC transport system substrate-binding protein